MNTIGIPGIMCTHESSEKIREMSAFASIEPFAGMSSNWLELEMAEWPDKDSAFDAMYHQLVKRNEDSVERVEWLTSIRRHRYGTPPSKDEL